MENKKMAKELFGTNGVRGVIGTEMNPELVMRIGSALGTMIKGRIAVGRDTRTSGEALASAMRAGLLSTGCDVVDVGILPTPALQYLVREHYDGGAMITASHNPPEYNGVKVIEGDGTEMGDDRTIQLEALIKSRDVTVADWRAVGRLTDESQRVEEYISSIVTQFPEKICQGMTVVVDPGSGPAATTTPEILRRMGAAIHTINARFDGTFPGRLPEPTPEGLAPLSEMVRATGAAFGVAHDGDADRAVFVDEKGVFVDENVTFALLAEAACKEKTGLVITPVSTSDLIADVASACGCRTITTPVGSIYVARTMRKYIEEGHTVTFGGEGNGGLIFPNHQFCRDGGMTAAAMAALIAGTAEPISGLAGRLPSYTMLKEKIHTRDPKRLISKMKECADGASLDETDGIRIRWKDTWALLRPSGTEPFVRLYVESRDPIKAEEKKKTILDQINH